MSTILPIEINGYPPTKTKPWQHQIIGWQHAKNHKQFLFGYDMGAGKTKSSIDYCNGFNAQKILIVCPHAVVSDVWPPEIQTHSTIPYRCLALDKGSVKKKKNLMNKFLRQTEAMKVPAAVIINLDSIWREPLGVSYDNYNKIVSMGFLAKESWDVIIIDESQRIKAHNSKVSKFLHKIGRTAERRLCLSGTFMDNSPLDVFGQYRFMNDQIFGKSYTRFKMDYAVEVNCGKFAKVVGFRNQNELNKKIFSICHRVKKSEVLKDLPPVKHIYMHCDLSSKARKIYNEMEQFFHAEADNGEITVQVAVVKLLRLAQITGGYLPLEDPDGIIRKNGQIIDKSKLDKLEYILDSLSVKEPVVIFTRFSKEIERIKELVTKKGRSVCELSGSHHQLEDWKAGDYDVIVIQIKAGCAGISLVRSAFIVYYSKGYSLGEYMQSLARVDRPGQTRPVTYYHLVANDTIDMVIEQALVQKMDIIEYILTLHKR